MPLEIIRNDITKMKVDAVVNPTDRFFSGGGGTDEAIHYAAGPQMFDECDELGGCEAGQARITGAYKLKAKYVIHTVGPVWRGGSGNEEELLADCYRNSLSLAKEYNVKSIAFPIISSGTFGYPKDRALRTATSVIGDFLLENDMDVFLVVYDNETFRISEKLFSSIKQYIDDTYIEKIHLTEKTLDYVEESETYEISRRHGRSLEDVLDELDETFSQTLLRLIDERGMTDVETYKKANVDKKLFSKIRSNKDYHPSKSTALAFAIALGLNLDETRDLLLRAGLALSNSSRFDVIVQYFIENGEYNIIEVNAALFAFNQKILGSAWHD